MNDQLSQAYDIDNRRAGSYTVKPGQDISATDNESAKSFLKRFTEARKDNEAFNVKASRAEDDICRALAGALQISFGKQRGKSHISGQVLSISGYVV